MRIIQLVFIFFILIQNSCRYSPSSGTYKNFSNKEFYQDEKWKIDAKEMVETQIIARGVRDEKVCNVMMNTPRHLFVSKEWESGAYSDTPLPIGNEQTISQPYMVAVMTELLHPQPTDKILEIGTGSGYQAAILSQLCDSVYTIEIIESLATEASELLKKLGFMNVVVQYGDGYKGMPLIAPFDKIIITAAPEEIPEELIGQLKNGGRMVLPLGSDYQELILVTKDEKGIVSKQTIFPVRFVPMIQKEELKLQQD